jgi:cytochrome c oxidase subunit 4
MAEQPNKERRANYLAIFIVLAVFTVIEALVSYLPQPAIKVPILVVLSVIKALLVLLFFMHLKFDQKVFSWLFFGAVALSIPLILILTIVMPAVLNR